MDDQREMTKHEVDVAFVDWRALTDRERAKVVRLARKGRFHPDQRVVETSIRWAFAMEVRPPPSRRKRLRGDASHTGLGLVVVVAVDFLSHAASTVLGPLLGGSAAARFSEGMFEVKTAQRVRRMAGSNPRQTHPDLPG